MKRLAKTVLALAASLSLLTACGGGGSGSGGGAASASLDAETQALVTKAREAGPVTIYSMIDEAALRSISDGFSKKYGLKVTPVRLVSSDLTQRYSAEATAGKPVADAVILTDSPFYADALKKGWIYSYPDLQLPSAAQKVPEGFMSNNGATPVVSLVPTDTVINTDNVKDKPSSWKDYADPKYKGKLMLAEPNSSPANAAFWSLMRDTYGDSFLQGVAANQPKWMGSAVPVTQAVAAGEGDLGHPGVAAVIDNLTKQGAPVERVSLTPTTGPEVALAVSKGSANEAGGKLMASYLLSAEGNKILNDSTSAISPFDTEATKGFTRVKDIKSVDAAKIRSLLGLK